MKFVRYRRFDPRQRKGWKEERYVAYLLTRQGPPRWVALGEAKPIDAAELRHHVMQTLPAGYFHDGTVLRKIAATRSDPLRLEALRRLSGVTDPLTVQTLLTIARDEKEDEKARVLAGAALPVLPGVAAGVAVDPGAAGAGTGAGAGRGPRTASA